MATYLDRSSTRTGRGRADRLVDQLLARARTGRRPGASGARCDGGAAADGLAVIAEVKRRSPSKGDLAPDLDPADAGRGLRGRRRRLPVGADRRRVLRRLARRPGRRPAPPCALPVLRKDFTVSALDVVDARLMGADAVLLIAAALDDARAGRLRRAGRRARPRRAGRDPRRGRARAGAWPSAPT